MKTLKWLGGFVAMLVVAGCASSVSITSTNRENIAAQAKVLAIAARNLEDSVHRNRADATQEDAARAVAEFHAAAETFTGTARTWVGSDKVDKQFEELIEAWVKMKQKFPDLQPDQLTRDAYKRVEYEWEKLQRATAYAGRKYQKKLEEGEGK